MSHITAHILDSTSGTPAAGVTVALLGSDEQQIATAATDADGRVRELGPDRLDAGEYRIVFAIGAYFEAAGVEHFHPRVTVDFTVKPDEPHYHIPLLLSPFAYSTYRGS